ncbi:MAG: ABC transporter permease [Phycisphaeraceae bacterium]|nr:ABC transporter permease [Phycisphaeraceae bacterium]MCW5762389.1 ABC transporter permease [Phycisphaeraceae bacterium]
MNLLAIQLLVRRDLVRLVRQPARIVATIATPLLLGLFLASGFARAASPLGADYGQYLLAGMLVLVVMFSSIFSAISLIDDRERGVLQGLLVSPLPWRSIALARLIGAAIAALAQACVLLLVAVAFGLAEFSSRLMLALLALTLVSIGTTGLGLTMAWFVRSKEGFHGIMNLVLMPMWLLSGAFFDTDSAAPFLSAIMSLNPLMHATEALRASTLHNADASAINWIIAGVYALVGFGLAMQSIGRPTRPGTI